MLQHRSRATDAIMVDEVGIEYGIFGDVRLKSEYRLIFGLHAGVLVPLAASAGLAAQKSGKPVPADIFRQCLMPEDQALIGQVGRRMHLRNAANIGESALDIHIVYDLDSRDDVEASEAEFALLCEEAARFDIQARRIVIEARGPGAVYPEIAARFAEDVREHGMRSAISLSALGAVPADGLSLVRPDVVRVERAWFHAIGRYLTSTRLLTPLVQTLTRRGAETIVEGVDSAVQLRTALAAGCNGMQGDFLARPGLAGTDFDLEPKPLDRLFDSDAAMQAPG